LCRRGKVFRAMERHCSENPGTFCFSRPIYCDRSWHPCMIEYGLLTKEGTRKLINVVSTHAPAMFVMLLTFAVSVAMTGTFVSSISITNGIGEQGLNIFLNPPPALTPATMISRAIKSGLRARYTGFQPISTLHPFSRNCTSSFTPVIAAISSKYSLQTSQ